MTKLYVAFQRELLVVQHGPDGWSVESRLEGVPLQCVAVDPERAGRIYCGTFGKGLWRSLDGGNSWEPTGKGMTYDEVTAVVVDRPARRGAPGVVYAGTEPSALFRSDDGGDRWKEPAILRRLPSEPSWSFPPRPHTHHVRWILPDPSVPGLLYLSVEAGALLRSLDGGKNWRDRTPDGPRDAHTVRVHRLAPGRVYVAAGDGYFESLDGGNSWTSISRGLRHHYIWSVAVDPGNPNGVVISAARGPGEAHNPRIAEATVYRRSGGAWEEVREGLPDPVGTTRSVLVAPEGRPGEIYLANNHGLYRSADGGRSWQRIEAPWPDRLSAQTVEGMAMTE